MDLPIASSSTIGHQVDDISRDLGSPTNAILLPQRPFGVLWLTLPDEVRCRIIEIALEDDGHCDFLTSDLIQNHVDRYFVERKNHGYHGFALLLLPETLGVSHIAREIFCSKSRAFVDAIGDEPHTTFKYPDRSFNKSLSGLIVNIGGFDTQFAFLEKVANHALGFEGLKHVSLSIRVHDLWESDCDSLKSAVDFLTKHPIVFMVDKLLIDYEPHLPINPLWIASNKAEYDEMTTQIQTLEQLVFNQISIRSRNPGKVLEVSQYDLGYPRRHPTKQMCFR